MTEFEFGRDLVARRIAGGISPESLLEELNSGDEEISEERARGIQEACEEAILAQALDEKPKAVGIDDLPESEAKILREFGQPTEEKNTMVGILVNGIMKTSGGHAVLSLEIAVRAVFEIIAQCDHNKVGIPLDHALGHVAQSVNDAAKRFEEMGRLEPQKEEEA